MGAVVPNGTSANKGILFSLSLLLCASVNWGPNMTTFVLPQDVIATSILATFNGISAASGKFGAVCTVGQRARDEGERYVSS